MFGKARTWFISHPSGGLQHTPTFFSAIDDFAATQGNLKVIFAHDKNQDIRMTQQAIVQADIILVEVSIPSTGSGIELGWANAVGKPIIAFHQGGAEPSPAIKFVATQLHVYVTADDITKILKTL